jgi:hypothetical protein
MVTEQDLLNDKWVQANNGYVKLGVTLLKKNNEWECHYVFGSTDIWTMSWNYRSLDDLYCHIRQTVEIIFNPKYNYLQSLTLKQKRTLKNWIL